MSEQSPLDARFANNPGTTNDVDEMSSNLFERFLSDFPEASVVLHSDTTVLWFNQAAAEQFSVQEGMPVTDIVDAGSHRKLTMVFERLRQGEDVVTELVLVVDGWPQVFSVHLFMHESRIVMMARGSSEDEEKFLEMSTMLSDFATLYRESSQQRSELEHQGKLLTDLADELESERKRLLTIIDQLPEAIVLVEDTSGEILLTNERVKEFWNLNAAPANLGEIPLYAPGSKRIQPVEPPVVQAIRTARDVGPRELLIFTDSHTPITVQAMARPILSDDGAPIGAAMSLIDVTEQKRMMDELASQAMKDPLTGLANRRAFFRAVDLAQSNPAEPFTVLYLDLDGFKTINDSLGHDAGDEALLEIAARLPHAVRDRDVIARIGGDEFALLLTGVGDQEAVELVVRRLLNEISRTLVIQGQTLRLSGSIGIHIVSPDSRLSTPEIVSRADMAMYQAKTAGTARWSYYDASLVDLIHTPVTLAEDIHYAIDHEQFELLYRPVVDLNSGRVREVEIAMFWRHVRDGLLDDEEIRSRAWRAGLLHAIAEHAAQLGANDRPLMLEALGARGDIVMSRHFWLEYLQEDRIIEQLIQIADDTAGTPIRVRMELSGRNVGGDDALLRNLWHLHNAGLELGLAHAGEFDGEMALLRYVPVAGVVASPALVQAPRDDQRAETMLRTLVQMAEQFQIFAKAPGVSTEWQLQRVRRAGFSFASGSMFGAPQSIADLLEQSLDHVFRLGD